MRVASYSLLVDVVATRNNNHEGMRTERNVKDNAARALEVIEAMDESSVS